MSYPGLRSDTKKDGEGPSIPTAEGMGSGGGGARVPLQQWWYIGAVCSVVNLAIWAGQGGGGGTDPPGGAVAEISIPKMTNLF